MALLKEAVTVNNFGLRAKFPWAKRSKNNVGTILREHITRKERKYVFEQLDDVELNQEWIERVENPFLWASYVLRFQEMQAVSRDVEEMIVIHATTLSNAYNIAEINFDWRMAHRCRYGRGVSFASYAGYAENQASDNEAYIVTGIMVDKCVKGNYGTKIPPNGVDTTVDKNGNVYVKYFDHEFYPYYIVY